MFVTPIFLSNVSTNTLTSGAASLRAVIVSMFPSVKSGGNIKDNCAVSKMPRGWDMREGSDVGTGCLATLVLWLLAGALLGLLVWGLG